ncbi:ATP-binding protein [Bacillus sp. CGMCC 1.16607]|uniref:ATP-binding protein n=1 Tax=Bacillus sp. CGMCC 1.16607 TaxID=3351842 RepID=UPI003640C9DD
MELVKTTTPFSSAVSLIGGGSRNSLAHNGILFVDEMAEFPEKNCLAIAPSPSRS